MNTITARLQQVGQDLEAQGLGINDVENVYVNTSTLYTSVTLNPEAWASFLGQDTPERRRATYQKPGGETIRYEESIKRGGVHYEATVEREGPCPHCGREAA